MHGKIEFSIDGFYHINFRLKNGIYYFFPESSTGKTCLMKLLKEYSKLGEPVCGFTYSDLKLNDKPNFSAKVVLLDRYDLYNGLYVDEMIRSSDRSIILIDCKSTKRITSKLALIKLVSPREIEVWG